MRTLLLCLLILLLVGCSWGTSPSDESNATSDESAVVERNSAAPTEAGVVESNSAAPTQAAPTATEPPAATKVPPTATESPTELPPTELPPTELPPTATEAPPTATPPPPTPTPTEVVPPPAGFDEVANWLAGFVTQESSSAAIQSALLDGGYLIEETNWQQADLNGDGVEEWVVLVSDPLEHETDVGPRSIVLMADRVSGEVVYEGGSDLFLKAKLLMLEDFTGDGRLEVLYRHESCGMHTCWQEYYMLSYHNATYPQQILSDGEQNGPVAMPATIWRVEERTGDGIKDLILEGGIFNSVGAGPQRSQVVLYAWNGERIALAEASYEANNLRYFRLLDANDAFILGQSEQAIALYEEAATSNELENSGWYPEGDEENAIKRYAAFRLLLTHLTRNDSESALQWLNWLLANYPAHPITEAAQLLYDEYTQSANLFTACAAVNDYAQTMPKMTSPLEDMGYGNPELTDETLCPFG